MTSILLVVNYNNISAVPSYNLPEYVVNLGPNAGNPISGYASRNGFSCPAQYIASFYMYIQDYFFNLQQSGQVQNYLIVMSLL